MSVQDNSELISFDDIPASNDSNKSFDINSERDSIHSFNGSDDKDTEHTFFEEEVKQDQEEEEEEEEEEETKATEPIFEEEKQVSNELNLELKGEEEEEKQTSIEQKQEKQEENVQNELDDGFGDFDDENNDDDDFGDFDDEFTGETDDFGDFNDELEVPVKQQEFIEEKNIPKTPTTAELYCNILNSNNINNITTFIDEHLNDIMNPNNTILPLNTEPKQVLSTQCSQELWDRLSRDSVFFNPVTGTVGQFQWIRSETNKSYLNALGVTINYDEKTGSSTNNSNSNARTTQKKRHATLPLDTSIGNNKSSAAMSAPSTPDGTTSHSRSASATISDGLRVATQHREEDKEAKREAEQEMELDIDIARAYCELTEETIRIFPDVKLNTMVVELKRLQRQAAEYLDALLDQREQLLMDAETYNDLISCIVGHAQRLREQNANKDASPAMVQKKKTGGKFGGLMRKKTIATNPSQSVSMGGGVVGVKQQQQQHQTVKKSLPVNESRRSL